MICPDPLHQIETGEVKRLWTHQLRIADALGGGALQEINEQYVTITQCFKYAIADTIGSFRQVPAFGLQTIRHFRTNVSEMHQFAARNYEDILQVRYLLFFSPGFSLIFKNSASYRFSRTSYQRNMKRSCLIFGSPLQRGTHMPSCVFIPTQLSNTSRRQQQPSEQVYGDLFA